MRGLVIFAALICAVVASKTPSYGAAQLSYLRPKDSTEEPSKDTTVNDDDIATLASGSTLKPSFSVSTNAASNLISTTKPLTEANLLGEEPAIVELVSEQPSALPPALPAEEFVEPSKRRIVTYDQRQEGQYNIRADLENFMIVLIPPSPADGLGLLDLLTKSSLKRTANTKKSKRKHYGLSDYSHEDATKYRQPLKAGNAVQNFNYLSRQPEANSLRGYTTSVIQPNSIVESGSAKRLTEFIEGRTPYHVDISANDEERLQPDRQVDVLPPPYPLAYQHYIKPYHLEAEPTVIQALPPPDVSSVQSTGNKFLDTYNQILASSLHSNNDAGKLANTPSNMQSRFYRLARAINGDSLIDTNRIAVSNSLGMFPSRRSLLPIYRSDLAFGAESRYPPIDVPRYTPTINSRTFELKSGDEREQNLENAHIGEIIVTPDLPTAYDEYDLDLRSVSGIDAQSKGLLRDGLERCAPGHRRDSYGLCREIAGY